MLKATETQADLQFECERGALRAELESNRAAFAALISTISDERWRQKSPTSAWTVGEVLVHLTWALEHLPQEVESARRGKGMFNLPKRLADPASYWHTRWQARRATRESLARRYDAAMAAVLVALDDAQASDWPLGARFYGERFYTIAELFRTPAQHFADHTAGI